MIPMLSKPIPLHNSYMYHQIFLDMKLNSEAGKQLISIFIEKKLPSGLKYHELMKVFDDTSEAESLWEEGGNIS